MAFGLHQCLKWHFEGGSPSRLPLAVQVHKTIAILEPKLWVLSICQHVFSGKALLWLHTRPKLSHAWQALAAPSHLLILCISGTRSSSAPLCLLGRGVRARRALWSSIVFWSAVGGSGRADNDQASLSSDFELAILTTFCSLLLKLGHGARRRRHCKSMTDSAKFWWELDKENSRSFS